MKKGKKCTSHQVPDVLSYNASVLHNTTKWVPVVPQPPTKDQSCPAETSFENAKTKENALSSASITYRPHRLRDQRSPNYNNHKDIYDFIREMALTKFNAEFLISRLKQWDLLDEDVRITFQRKKHCGFLSFFSFKVGLWYCHDIRKLF